MEEELARLDAELEGPRRKEYFSGVLRRLEESRKRRADPEWEMWIDKRFRELNLELDKLQALLRDEAVHALRKGDEPAVRRIQERVASWNLEGRRAELDRALAATSAETTVAKPPVPPAPPSDAERLWGRVVGHAAARDFEAAIREFDSAVPEVHEEGLRREALADLEALRGARTAYDAILRSISTWPKERKLSLRYLDLAGDLQRIEGTLIHGEPGRLELIVDRQHESVPLGQVMAGSLAGILLAQESRRPSVHVKGLALFCLLDGDPEGALELQGPSTIEEKYRARAKAIASARAQANAEDKEASTVFHSAETSYANPATRVDGVLKYRALLTNFRETTLVRRNRATIASRSEGGKEYTFVAADIKPTGPFRFGRHNQMESCWISEMDGGPERMKDTYLEFSFSALLDAEYRCWVYVGGCCLEVLGFSAQGTELSAKIGQKTALCELGSDAFWTAKPTVFGLRKDHSSHQGVKQPDRWIWVQIPIPRYGSSGAKRIRLYTNQKGFGVAYAFVSSLRKAPPRDADLEEIAKARADRGNLLQPADPSLVGWWKLDERAGGTAADFTLHRNGGVLHGSPTSAAGKIGGALSFDGADDYMTVPHSATLDLGAAGQSYAIALWYRRSGNPSGIRGIMGKNDGVNTRYPFDLITLVAGHVAFAVHDGAKMAQITSRNVVTDGGWHHLVSVRDGSSRVLRLYVDGAEAGTPVSDSIATSVQNATPIWLARNERGGALYHDAISLDEVRIYNRALSPAEIASLAAAPASPR